jgi:4-amino-4-deoxy-L-arabinose transferase-like glycosyltransferase
MRVTGECAAGRRISRPRQLGILVVILLAAAFLRTYRLDEIPPGLTHDEADTGYFVSAVYRGEPSQVQAPYGYAYKPFSKYSAAFFMVVFGQDGIALRYHSAFWGITLVLFTYLWARKVFGPAVGLGGAALVACSFWTVCDSRFALNSGPAPALFTAAVYFLWRALDDGAGRKCWPTWAAFVVALTASLYTYEAALAASGSLVLLLLHLALVQRSLLRRQGGRLIAAMVVVALLAAPHLLSPSAWGRTTTLSDPLRSAASGDWKPLLGNAVGALATFTFRGDSFVTYSLPGRPVFDPAISLLFYGGIVLCLRRWRQPRYAFVLMWLLMGIVPSLVIGEWTSTLHSKAAQAPVLVLPALAAAELGRIVDLRFGRGWLRTLALACFALLVLVAVSTAYDYFVRWGEAPETRAAYFHNLVTVMEYLNDSGFSGAVALSAPFPDQPLDPFVADLTLHREDLALRWFDGGRALVFPCSRDGLLIIPSAAPLAEYFTAELPLGSADRVDLRPDDLEPFFDVHRWDPQAALGVVGDLRAAPVSAGGQLLHPPVDFGGAAELVGYAWEPASVAPGDALQVVTEWRVSDPLALGSVPAEAYGPAGVLFSHLLDDSGTLVGQEDRLDAPAWNWQEGDHFLQLHVLSVPEEAVPGAYRVEIGLYNRHDELRVPVVLEGVAIDDRVLLPQLEVIGG